MITVSGWCAGAIGRGAEGMGRWMFSQWGGLGKKLSKCSPTSSWQKELSRRKPGAYSNISPKRPTLSFSGGSRLGELCRGALLGRVEREGEKKFGSTSKRPVNILNAVIKSNQIHRRCKQWRSSRCSHRCCQLPTLKLIFQFALDGWYLPRGLANRLV